jgi:hypothetical protein
VTAAGARRGYVVRPLADNEITNDDIFGGGCGGVSFERGAQRPQEQGPLTRRNCLPASTIPDCPDVDTVDSHIARLRRRLAKLGAQHPDITQVSRADIDRLLDRRAWLTLPVAHYEADLPAAS